MGGSVEHRRRREKLQSSEASSSRRSRSSMCGGGSRHLPLWLDSTFTFTRVHEREWGVWGMKKSQSWTYVRNRQRYAGRRGSASGGAERGSEGSSRELGVTNAGSGLSAVHRSVPIHQWRDSLKTSRHATAHGVNARLKATIKRRLPLRAAPRESHADLTLSLAQARMNRNVGSQSRSQAAWRSARPCPSVNG